MGSPVLSRTTSLSYQSICWRKWRKIWTSTCSTLRQSGVHSVTRITSATSVCTHITGRTSGERPRLSSTCPNSALAGKPRKIRKPTKTAANWSTDVACATAGRNWSTTRSSSRRRSAAHSKVKVAPVASHTAPTTTMRRKSACLSKMVSISSCSPGTEASSKVRLLSINRTSFKRFSKTRAGLKLLSNTPSRITTTQSRRFTDVAR